MVNVMVLHRVLAVYWGCLFDSLLKNALEKNSGNVYFKASTKQVIQSVLFMFYCSDTQVTPIPSGLLNVCHTGFVFCCLFSLPPLLKYYYFSYIIF